MRKIEFSEEQLKEIFNLYQKERWGMRKIGQKFNVSNKVIKRVLTEANIETKNDNHRYHANFDYFKNIDSDEKAYWLGFLAADGCVYVRPENATVFINIHSKDRVHLEKFNKSIESDYPIKDIVTSAGFSNNTPMSRLAVNSKKMAQDLIDKNVTPRKSLTLQPPNISELYYLPFIAGYFDGDGSISCSQDGKTYHMSILGTREILEWIKENLNWQDASLRKRRDDDKNNFYISCGGTNKPYKLISTFYEKSPIHLDRKFKKYNDLKTVVLNRNI